MVFSITPPSLTAHKQMKYLNILVALVAFFCGPLMAQSKFSDAFKKGFAEVVQTTAAEQPQKIDALKATLGEKEILTIRVAVDNSASESDIHFYLGDLALDIFDPDNPWSINTPGGIPMEKLPWNVILKSVNHHKQMSWENGLMGGLGPWKDTYREHALALPVLVKWAQQGVFKVVPAPAPAPPGEWQLDTSQWQVSEGLTIQQDRRRYVKELPHHPWYLLSLGDGRKRPVALQSDSAKSDGNLSYLSWTKSPLGEKQKVSHVVYRTLTRVIIPAGKTVNGKWQHPTLAEAQAKARELDGPSTYEAVGTPVATAPKVQEVGSQVATPETPTASEPMAVATPVPPTEAEKTKQEAKSEPTTASSEPSNVEKKQTQGGLNAAIWALTILFFGSLGALVVYRIKKSTREASLGLAKDMRFADSIPGVASAPESTPPKDLGFTDSIPGVASAPKSTPDGESKPPKDLGFTDSIPGASSAPKSTPAVGSKPPEEPKP